MAMMKLSRASAVALRNLGMLAPAGAARATVTTAVPQLRRFPSFPFRRSSSSTGEPKESLLLVTERQAEMVERMEALLQKIEEERESTAYVLSGTAQILKKLMKSESKSGEESRKIAMVAAVVTVLAQFIGMFQRGASDPREGEKQRLQSSHGATADGDMGGLSTTADGDMGGLSTTADGDMGGLSTTADGDKGGAVNN